jgi:hypothetical protein
MQHVPNENKRIGNFCCENIPPLYCRCMATPTMHPTENQGETRSDWVSAPSESHVARFQLTDHSASEFGASSSIVIVFKAKQGRIHKPESSYRYKFSSHDQARGVFDALCGSAHPGEVIDQQLKKPNVPCERVS